MYCGVMKAESVVHTALTLTKTKAIITLSLEDNNSYAVRAFKCIIAQYHLSLKLN